MNDIATRDRLIEEDKITYGLYKMSEMDCGDYIKIFYATSRYDCWVEIIYKDNSKHILEER
jgi:hypothetical protein